MNVEPLMKFLNERRIHEKQEKMLKRKFNLMSKTAIGKEIGINRHAKIDDLPLTSYPLYRKFFNNPIQEAFMYPLKYYTKALTTGSMANPKWYLNPLPMEIDSAVANLSSIMTVLHDGERYRIEEGYTIYANLGPPPFQGGISWNRMIKSKPSISKIISLFKFYEPSRIFELSKILKLSKKLNFLPPDQGAPYLEKVEIFIKNYKKIDVALMVIGTFLNLVHPRVNEPIPLKAFATLDPSGDFYREEIKEITGVYPSTVYGSTETGTCGIPSPEHTMGLFFDWRTAYYEFLPEKNFCSTDIRKKFESKVIPLDEVKVGKKYQLIITNLQSELTRYIMPDVFQCISKGDNLLGIDFPIFKYHTRAFNQISLHNFTIIDERTILSALKAADLKINDFTARLEVADGMDYLALYIEPIKKYKKSALLSAIHRSLCDVDKGYSEISKYQKYTPLRITILPRGTFSEFLKKKIGMARVIRINMNSEDSELLSKIKESRERNVRI